jgi:hypothetical protein
MILQGRAELDRDGRLRVRRCDHEARDRSACHQERRNRAGQEADARRGASARIDIVVCKHALLPMVVDVVNDV